MQNPTPILHGPNGSQLMQQFKFEQVDSWPPLAWLARLKPDEQQIRVWHGDQVELQPTGFCEAIWDGDFAEFNFDRTDVVFGSGVRSRKHETTFVSSGTTADRLNVFRENGNTWISNSLVCLTEVHDLDFNVTYGRYLQDFMSIMHGLQKAVKHVVSDKGTVELVYFHNLRWDGTDLKAVAKPNADRDFGTFEELACFLTQSMSRLGTNMQFLGRRKRFEPLTTLSSGYDSSTVAVLCKGIGTESTICFRDARGGGKDDGTPIAQQLGYQVISADRNDWRQLTFEEMAPFLAHNGYGEELHFAAIAEHLSGRALFTGFHGDKIWGKKLADTSGNIVRGDHSGSSLGEFRLWQGFIHCPIPFLGSRNTRSFHKISNAPDMRTWDVPGDYSRPICRRFVESAGIPRDAFGVQKKATNVIMRKREDAFLPPQAACEFEQWLIGYKWNWLKKVELPPQWKLDVYGLPGVGPIIDMVLKQCLKSEELPAVWRLANFLEESKARPRSNYLFPWAMPKARTRYRLDPHTVGTWRGS